MHQERVPPGLQMVWIGASCVVVRHILVTEQQDARHRYTRREACQQNLTLAQGGEQLPRLHEYIRVRRWCPNGAHAPRVYVGKDSDTGFVCHFMNRHAKPLSTANDALAPLTIVLPQSFLTECQVDNLRGPNIALIPGFPQGRDQCLRAWWHRWQFPVDPECPPSHRYALHFR